MTARVHSLTLVLDGDIREDDLEPLMHALRQFRLVVGVEKNVADAAGYAYQHRADMRIHELFVAIQRAIVIDDLPGAIAALNALEPRP